jgi:hypothetical protein
MNRSFTLCLALLLVGTATWTTVAQEKRSAAPSFTKDGKLVRPGDYREWVFVTSGIGMTYGPAQPAAGRPPLFDNVFVTRAAYAEFLRSGSWPDKTMFVLEIRRGEENVSINKGGRTQGAIAAIEASVKDLQRFKDTGGWGYFSFDGPTGLTESAAPLPATAPCYACHKNNTAVDNTFVQFYPTLFEAAERHGTIKPSYHGGPKP